MRRPAGAAALLVAEPLRVAAQDAAGVGASASPGAAAVAPATQPAAAGPAATQSVEVRVPSGGSRPAQPLISLNFKDASVDAVLEHLSEVAGFVVVKEGPVAGPGDGPQQAAGDARRGGRAAEFGAEAGGYTAIADGARAEDYPRDKAKKGNIPVHFGADPIRSSRPTS